MFWRRHFFCIPVSMFKNRQLIYNHDLFHFSFILNPFKGTELYTSIIHKYEYWKLQKICLSCPPLKVSEWHTVTGHCFLIGWACVCAYWNAYLNCLILFHYPLAQHTYSGMKLKVNDCLSSLAPPSNDFTCKSNTVHHSRSASRFPLEHP